VSKLLKPRKPTVALRPSRIRRDPLLVPAVDEKKVQARSQEREIWGGVGGVLLFAAAIATAIVGLSAATIAIYFSEPAPRPGHFGHCYNEGGANCVLDGGTIYVAGEKVAIAGMDAPGIVSARCSAERTQGIEAAVRLAALLNSGKVIVGGAFRDKDGREVRKVEVNGEEVGAAMIDAGLARKSDGTKQDWCATAG
jgi:endonuclease YncB( thermonuclease family)